jgi:hypothetical protein
MSKKRTYIFTEEQLKKFLGEEFTTYLDKSDNGSDFNGDSLESNYSEIKPTETGGDNPPTTDKIAGEKIPTFPWVRRSYNTIYEGKKKRLNDKGEVVPETCPECGCEIGLYIKGEPVYLCSNKKCNKYFGTMPFSKNLNERNHQLDGKKFRLGKNTNQMIDTIAQNNQGDRMINNMSDNKDINISTLYTRLNRLKKMKTEKL